MCWAAALDMQWLVFAVGRLLWMWGFDIPGTKTQGVFSWIPSSRVIWGKAELSFCHKEYDTGDSEDISGDDQDNWTETGPIFSHSASLAIFPVLYGEFYQIPQIPVEGDAVFYWKGENSISQYVYMWNDKDYWKNQSGINVLADKIAVSRESGVNFY